MLCNVVFKLFKSSFFIDMLCTNGVSIEVDKNFLVAILPFGTAGSAHSMAPHFHSYRNAAHP